MFRRGQPLGMLLLAIWLILQGALPLLAISVPPALLGGLAIAAGVLLLMGR
ncbi:MAG: hypothetical protein U1D30_19875 [Planctomycetota bacterium]